MAGCKSTLTGEDFYGPYDAQDNAKAHAKELGMDTVPSLNITYTEVSMPICAHCLSVSLWGKVLRGQGGSAAGGLLLKTYLVAHSR